MTTEQKVLAIIEDHFTLPPETITPDTNLTSDLQMDSLDTIELVMSLESAFSISILDDDIDENKLHTVFDIVKYIEGRIK